ncbi:putative bifunctional diguanylate cyclase/phosphodiesterase [Paracraurococcus lichenis]|uniref:EAL domain-containing protein n=1 Tax=Paracraurococcus lichenis TaxID=3064888 RepID=A0ABT9EA43_9PROT|nr:EAL domain-containing protein [Paracraurococcus sp. LOR1-02]MDO9713072.1 EAL domain-containing protein [Paracraurococcus sp. LOR1-02]
MSFSALALPRILPQARGLLSHWMTLKTPEADMVRIVTLLAAMASVVIALCLPAAYLFAVHGRLQGALETSATLHAAEVVELARQNPAFWEFDGLRIAAPADAAAGKSAERRRVFDAKGRLVVEAADEDGLAWPVLTRRAPIYDADMLLGETEAARSIRTELSIALALAMTSALLGGAIFVVLRVVPLRLLRRALDRAAYLAAHDLLTGLPNRGIFGDRLRQAMTQSHRNGQPLAVFCLDLDRFKEVNDTLGHAAGDKLLREVSRRLSACLRDSDTLARLGGDEFAVIQPRVAQPHGAEALARRIIAAVEPPIDLDGQQVTVGVSVGIALSQPEQAIEPLQLLKDADLALYQVKENGRGDFCFFAPEMNQRLMERRALEADLRRALGEGEFRLHYQPQIDLPSGRVIGAEALLRWNRPGWGNVSPDQFIPLAEETGLIAQIGAWTLQEACRLAVTWPEELGVAVNVSAVQFRLPGLYEAVAAALATTGLRPSRLELEITEGVLLHDTDETLAMLYRLRRLGVKIAMDDFGTGYSSLGYLQKFSFDKIKIDRGFIRSLGQDANSEAIVRAVVGITRSLGVRANAEGVETDSQARLLQAEGCGEVQGYLFGKPMPAEDFRAFFLNVRPGRG